jgi:alpha-L-rhamnosidase
VSVKADVNERWVDERLDPETFEHPTPEFGILPFWFLNGELDPDEMRFQLRELADKRMRGVVLHGRYGLELPYLSDGYLDRIGLAAEEARTLGLSTWIYDEMNWPSGTADKRVLKARPDLAQRYIECISFEIQGPWFMCLTGEDSRYLDFERSDPVAAFATGQDGTVVDLTPNLSFERVVPWEVPPGPWRLSYVVQKRADYYIDAMDPESTRMFLELGYAPYLRAAGNGDGSRPLVGFYSDEPAMHYYMSGGDNPVLPWTKNMFRRFRDRNGYELRPRLLDLFFDVRPDSARVRHDYFNTTTDFYTNAYYRQLREWCNAHGMVFTAHLLYEEWLRRMIRVEGNLFRHYENMDIVAVDHLYPVIGTRTSPDQHVALKVASSAAHQFGSPRVICESFGGIFMDATMQRMKWIADWEYVLGVTVLNPHGFHYTLEGNRKRDWPPSQFYQYPWWRHYGVFNDYVSRLSRTLSGGRHLARVAVLWPINAMFATYTPQQRNEVGDRIEDDFNALTDLLMRLHVDFDYLDEDVLARSELRDGAVHVGDEAYEVVVVPPMAHVRASTLDRLEELVGQGGGVLGGVLLPGRAFGPEGLSDVAARVRLLFGVDPAETRGSLGVEDGATVEARDDVRVAFVRAGRIAGRPTANVHSMAQAATVPPARSVVDAYRGVLARLLPPDVEIDNEELFSLRRTKDGREVVFVVNPTFEAQEAGVRVHGAVEPHLWDPSTGADTIVAPSRLEGGWTSFHLRLPPVGSAFVVLDAPSLPRVIASTFDVEAVERDAIVGTTRGNRAGASVDLGEGTVREIAAAVEAPPAEVVLDGSWAFEAEGGNALVLEHWVATDEPDGGEASDYAGDAADESVWTPMVPGAWAYQLPAEPARGYPIPVWFRIPFEADVVPLDAHLVLDGFAGENVRLFVNGTEIKDEPARAPFDSQMRIVDIARSLRAGRNVLAVRMDVGSATGGLLDRVKILGALGVEERDGRPVLVGPTTAVRPGPWTEQGYPFFSGTGHYRTTASLPAEIDGCRVAIRVPTRDDVVEVFVNGVCAGVRLWHPYQLDVTALVRPGDNEIEIRVSNTPANLLNAERRPSGLAGAPVLVPTRPVRLEIPR